MEAVAKSNLNPTTKYDFLIKLAIFFLPIFMLIVFIDAKYSVFCGPVLAVILTFLFFVAI
jgi:hypothetical protein